MSLRKRYQLKIINLKRSMKVLQLFPKWKLL
nr:MAG TPA: hypothetical protein [Caudoviricetes sp.]